MLGAHAVACPPLTAVPKPPATVPPATVLKSPSATALQVLAFHPGAAVRALPYIAAPPPLHTHIPIATRHHASRAGRQVLHDVVNERPAWLLSCYGHERGGPNDLVGDVSFEEARRAAL